MLEVFSRHRRTFPGMNNHELAQRGTVSVVEAAEFLGVSRNTAYHLVRTGEIPAIKLGRLLRVPVGWLLEQGRLDASTLLLVADLKDT